MHNAGPSAREGPPRRLGHSTAVLRLFLVTDHLEDSGEAIVPPADTHLCVPKGTGDRELDNLSARADVTSSLFSLGRASGPWSPIFKGDSGEGHLGRRFMAGIR